MSCGICPTAELDADRVLPLGSVIISNRRMGNGFRIRNCTVTLTNVSDVQR